MTCGEAREYLFAFLDNEVDAPLSIELQRHLDGCPHCAREAEIERTIRKRLSGRIEAAADDLPRFADVLRSALPRRDEARVVRGPRPTRFRLRLQPSLRAYPVTKGRF
ncbi:MAG: anti-sigma factor family protein, partial [Phycisphaerae bacterium]